MKPRVLTHCNQQKKRMSIIQNESEARHLPKDFAKITRSLGSCLQIKNMYLHTTKVPNRPFALWWMDFKLFAPHVTRWPCYLVIRHLSDHFRGHLMQSHISKCRLKATLVRKLQFTLAFYSPWNIIITVILNSVRALKWERALRNVTARYNISNTWHAPAAAWMCVLPLSIAWTCVNNWPIVFTKSAFVTRARNTCNRTS